MHHRVTNLRNYIIFYEDIKGNIRFLKFLNYLMEPVRTTAYDVLQFNIKQMYRRYNCTLIIITAIIITTIIIIIPTISIIIIIMTAIIIIIIFITTVMIIAIMIIITIKIIIIIIITSLTSS